MPICTSIKLQRKDAYTNTNIELHRKDAYTYKYKTT